MKISLGVDPGYSSEGFTVIGEREDGSPTILHSRCITAGTAGDLRSFKAKSRRAVEEIYTEFPFTQWATEVMPVPPNMKTALHLWFAGGMLWEAIDNLTGLSPRYVAAVSVKRSAETVLGLPHKKDSYTTKLQVRLAVQAVTGEHCRTNHEDDAALVALTAFYPKWIKPAASLPPSKAGPSRKASIRA